MQCEKEQAGRLHHYLTELHLPTIRRCYQETAISARRDNWEYESYLLELAEREREARRNARTARLLKDSKLPLEKNLKAFNRKRLPRKVDTQLTLLLNPQKDRLETLDVEFTAANTTHFTSRGNGSITMITDWDGGLLIKSEFDYSVYIYDVQRVDIGFSQKKARELKQRHL